MALSADIVTLKNGRVMNGTYLGGTAREVRLDMGDHVVVVNAEKIHVTGLKAQQKMYRRYTGFPGGLREEGFTKLLARRPEKIVEEAIKGMLPKSKLGRQMATKLKVYKGAEHPHHAQQPVALELHPSGKPAAKQAA